MMNLVLPWLMRNSLNAVRHSSLMETLNIASVSVVRDRPVSTGGKVRGWDGMVPVSVYEHTQMRAATQISSV